MDPMQQTITIQLLIQIGIIIMGIWGFVKVVKEIVKSITDRHDREQKWDEYEENLQKERDRIYEKYDSKLEETDGQIKDIKEEMKLQTLCIQAILDGLIQLNCNGNVTEAKRKLDAHLNERAHE